LTAREFGQGEPEPHLQHGRVHEYGDAQKQRNPKAASEDLFMAAVIHVIFMIFGCSMHPMRGMITSHRRVGPMPGMFIFRRMLRFSLLHPGMIVEVLFAVFLVHLLSQKFVILQSQ
jgi:hypothetical protein